MSPSQVLPSRRLIVAHARAQAFAPMTRAILARMGYRIVPVEELGLLPSHLVTRPDLRLVDERLLEQLAHRGAEPANEPPVPIVLLTGRRGMKSRDPRIIGAVRKPAGLHDLYRLIQQVLEETPRTAPRVPTQLVARCRRGEKQWTASVLSLSENGCLLRSDRSVPLGARFELAIDLPGVGTIETEAEAAYQFISDLGLVFHATPPTGRRAIVDYVTGELVAA